MAAKLPFLFEIGTEEIPASYLSAYSRQMTELLEKFFQDSGLAFEPLAAAWTPRRLAFFCPALETQQPVTEAEVKGPPVAVAYKDGVPGKAAEAFAAKVGLPLEKVGRVQEGGREYLFAKVSKGGARTADLLKEGLPGLVRALRSPKSMHWDSLPTVFARPIRSLTALLGSETIACELDGLVATSHVKGHRFLSPAGFDLASADWQAYEEGLEKNCVVLDYDRRCALIKSQLLALGAREESLDYDLLGTCANLTEYPKAIKGSIAPEYLELPPEVLITTLKKHQKSFPCYGPDGRLEAAFLSVTNNDLQDADTIRSGYERVITARLADAKFFWDEDRRTPFGERLEKLGGVVFQKDIGTYLAKSRRVAKVCRRLGELCGQPEAAEKAAQAALLSRCDLTTAMVFEFPELQGTMGRVYAACVDGAEPEVAAAIEEMYQPRSANDSVPASLPGAILSICDKLDTIIGCVAVGLAPTGSADPYMLRRQTFGMLKTIIAHKLVFQLSELARTVLTELYGDSESFKKELAESFAKKLGIEASSVSLEALEKAAERWFRPLPAAAGFEKSLLSLIQGRFETVLKDEGVSYDIVQAVFGAPWPGIYINTQKALQLNAIRGEAEFLALCNMLTRCVNIAKDEKKGKAAPAVEPALFADQAEKDLWTAWEGVRPQVAELADSHRFSDAVRLLASRIAGPLDRFFTEVRIYAEDPQVCANRLAILKTLSEAIRSGLADLSKVVSA